MRHGFVLGLTLAILAVSLAGCGNDSGGGGSGLAGTYSMDAGEFLAKMEEMMMEQMGPMIEQMPPEQVAKMKEEMRAGAKDAAFELAVNADGTFQVTATKKGDTEVTTGTWTQEGDVISFVETEKDGKPVERPDTIKGTYKDGKLTLTPDAELGFEIVLTKK